MKRKKGGGIKRGRGGSVPTESGRQAGCWAGAPPWETVEHNDQSAFEEMGVYCSSMFK